MYRNHQPPPPPPPLPSLGRKTTAPPLAPHPNNAEDSFPTPYDGPQDTSLPPPPLEFISPEYQPSYMDFDSIETVSPQDTFPSPPRDSYLEKLSSDFRMSLYGEAGRKPNLESAYRSSGSRRSHELGATVPQGDYLFRRTSRDHLYEEIHNVDRPSFLSSQVSEQYSDQSNEGAATARNARDFPRSIRHASASSNMYEEMYTNNLTLESLELPRRSSESSGGRTVTPLSKPQYDNLYPEQMTSKYGTALRRNKHLATRKSILYDEMTSVDKYGTVRKPQKRRNQTGVGKEEKLIYFQNSCSFEPLPRPCQVTLTESILHKLTPGMIFNVSEEGSKKHNQRSLQASIKLLVLFTSVPVCNHTKA